MTRINRRKQHAIGRIVVTLDGFTPEFLEGLANTLEVQHELGHNVEPREGEEPNNHATA